MFSCICLLFFSLQLLHFHQVIWSNEWLSMMDFSNVPLFWYCLLQMSRLLMLSIQVAFCFNYVCLSAHLLCFCVNFRLLLSTLCSECAWFTFPTEEAHVALFCGACVHFAIIYLGQWLFLLGNLHPVELVLVSSCSSNYFLLFEVELWPDLFRNYLVWVVFIHTVVSQKRQPVSSTAATLLDQPGTGGAWNRWMAHFYLVVFCCSATAPRTCDCPRWFGSGMKWSGRSRRKHHSANWCLFRMLASSHRFRWGGMAGNVCLLFCFVHCC